MTTHLGPRSDGCFGACLVPGPQLDEAIQGAIACAVTGPTGDDYAPIDLQHDDHAGRRLFRRPHADEACLGPALQARLDDLGLTHGMRAVANPSDNLASRMTIIRSLVSARRREPATTQRRTRRLPMFGPLCGQAGCGPQTPHRDREFRSSDPFDGLPLGKVPLSILWAFEDDTTLIIEGQRHPIPTGWLLIFRGDLCHAGDEYEEMNTRAHAYLDLLTGKYVSVYTDTHFCA